MVAQIAKHNDREMCGSPKQYKILNVLTFWGHGAKIEYAMGGFIDQAIQKGLIAVIFGIILPVAFCLWILAYVWVTHPERARFSVWYLRSITLVEILKSLLARLRFLARPFFIRVKR